MTVRHVSIGQVKRDISELVNRVAFGNERIVLTSRGKPKAAIVSLEDLARLQEEKRERRVEEWDAWLTGNERLTHVIRERRQGREIDVDRLWAESREDLEARDSD